MIRDRVRTLCSALPGVTCDGLLGPGHDSWKVGGKMFAAVGARDTGVSVKTDSVETAQMLIDAGVGARAPYCHASWVHLPEGCPDDELRHRLLTSYDIIRAGLTRKAQAALAPRD